MLDEDNSFLLLLGQRGVRKGHDADAWCALAGATVAEGITPVGMGPRRDFVVTEKSCFLQDEDGDEVARALNDALSTSARYLDPVAPVPNTAWHLMTEQAQC